MEKENPFPECIDCKDLGDCPSPEVAQDLMGSPLPNSACPKPLDIMKATVKKRRLKNYKYGLS
jgi:hypothetical protein